jgi:hypothetical protein
MPAIETPLQRPGSGHPARLLDRVRGLPSVRRYSLRTEEACVNWSRRFIRIKRLSGLSR